jgi:hypothetical protein
MENELKEEILHELKSLEYNQTLSLKELTQRTNSDSINETKLAMEKVMEENRITSTPDWEFRMGR